MRTLSATTGTLHALLLCALASAPCARAAGQRLTQTFTPCAIYTDADGYGVLVAMAELTVPARTRSVTFLGENLGEYFFVAAASKDLSAFDVDIINDNDVNDYVEIVDFENSSTNGCYAGAFITQCPYTGRIIVDIYCKNLNSPCHVVLDLYTKSSCSSTGPALAPASGSAEPTVDPVFEAPSEPDVRTPVPEPDLDGAPASSTDSSLIFWCYRRRQRRARSNAEPDLGIGDFVMDKAVEQMTKDEEASSETSDVAVEF
ncbi:hypothetical protein ACK3TF_005750 [Chlorella vulgaris]